MNPTWQRPPLKLLARIVQLLLLPSLLLALEPGWNLVGALLPIDGDLFNRPWIEAVWTYDRGEWRFRGSSQQEGCLPIDRIEAGQGFWVLARERRPGAFWVARGTSWYWQLQGPLDLDKEVDLYDIDLFDTSKEEIAKLHEKGRIVICYFSAGTLEEWRPDVGKLLASRVVGRSYEGWPGEYWLDIRALEVRDLALSRLDLARAKGCDGVEPDNVDGYLHESGFELSYEDQLAFNRFLAREAHKRGLLIALKNDLEQIEDLVEWFDFAINEECFAYNECGRYLPFLERNKAVLNAEYEGLPPCEQARLYGISSIFLDPRLDGSRFESCLQAPTPSNGAPPRQ
ncbi:MAG: endo alpha-1,4 polygalactosaminidase [Nitratiruptor sp.]|nr:endo alpha-1,4 polygalactosaminidase [Nitratiruptor sp.]NPA84346.1 endo alpha-1,4 polygalactosaminidase [Campylobacterota bacterium]